MSSELQKQRLQNQMFVESVLFDAVYEPEFYQELRFCVFDTLEEFASEEVPRGITGFVLNYGFWRALFMDYHYSSEQELQSNVTAELFTSLCGADSDNSRYNRALQHLIDSTKDVPIRGWDKPTVFDSICNCDPLAKRIRMMMNAALDDAEKHKPEAMQKLRDYILFNEL